MIYEYISAKTIKTLQCCFPGIRILKITGAGALDACMVNDIMNVQLCIKESIVSKTYSNIGSFGVNRIKRLICPNVISISTLYVMRCAHVHSKYVNPTSISIHLSF